MRAYNQASPNNHMTTPILRPMGIALMMAFIANGAGAQTAAKEAIQQSIKTIYPTKDWVVSDFVVTDARFGAKAEPGFDNRAAFQAAIDAAYKGGGGVVYIPA